jgi:nitrile hydratase subunit beta
VNGAQDLGGMMGFGPIAPEKDEPVFHAEWEKRALAVTLAAGALGEWSVDRSRLMRESLHPVDYLTSSYYEVWIKALEQLLVAHGLATAEEIARGQSRSAPKPTSAPLAKGAVAAALAAGTPYARPEAVPARFAPGDGVRTLNLNPAGHTRLPRYARGKHGRVERVHGVFVVPDANAHGLGERPEWLYSVCFAGKELWGDGGEHHGAEVLIDAWESYLERAAP